MKVLGILTTLLTFTTLFIFLKPAAKAVSDTTPPVSSLVQNPSSPDGLNDWYITPVDITINSDDLESGVESINWTLDGQGSSETFTSTLNLVQNPSFEDPGSPIDLWDKTNPDADAVFTQDPTPAPSLGSYSARIDATAGTWHAFSNRSNFAVASSLQNMTSSVWIKTENVTGSAYYKIYLVYDNGAGDSGVSLVGSSGSVSGTAGWQKLSLNFIPNHADTIGVYMEAGIEGSGSVYFDGASISGSISAVSANFAVSANGNHTLSYFARDNAGNEETAQNTSFKVDTKAPSRWTNFTLTQSGNDHTFIVSIKVTDSTSGLDVSTAEFQYSVDEGVTWGYYTDLMSCSSSFVQGWRSVSASPNIDGSNTVTITTPAVDFCNSNWSSTKKIRFRITDMAGNLGQSSDFSINGAWVDINGGNTYSNFDVSMQNSQGENVIGASGEVAGVTSAQAWYLENYEVLPFLTYDDWYAKYPTTTGLPSGKLPTTSGRYRVNSDFTIASNTVPSGLSSAQNMSSVVFVNGDLNVNTNYSLHATSGIIFIVKGDITVANNVSSMDGYFITDGYFDVGSGGTALTITGGAQADTFNLKRSLSGSQNQTNPAEAFNYVAKYIVVGRNILADNYTVTWVQLR